MEPVTFVIGFFMMRKEYLKLAIPNILTNLTIPLVSLVDVGLMGRMPSSNYIIAIGLGTVIFNFLYWAFGFLRMGTTGFVAQAFGRKDNAKISEALIRGLLIGLIGGVVIILFQVPFFKIATYLLGITSNITDLVGNYFYCRVWDAPAAIALFVIQGWLLGMQQSKQAFYLALFVNGVNIICSYLFVYSFDLSIYGVALGSVISQYLGCIYGLLLIRKKFDFTLSKDDIRTAMKGNWKEFFSVNRDIFIRTMCLIFTLSFFKVKAANIDPLLGAANILLLEFITITAYGIDGLAFAAESISGKYFGAKNKEQFQKSVAISFRLGLQLSIVISILFFFFGEEILKILTDKEEVIAIAMNFIPWLILAPVVNVIAFIWDGVFIGCTASKEMRNTLLIATFLIFLPCYFVFHPLFGNHGIWLSLILFMLARGLVQTILYKKKILAQFN